MSVLWMVVLIQLLLPLFMRGGTLHNHLADQAAESFRSAGFEVELEHSLRLPDGRADFIDVLAQRDKLRIACEIETTERHVDLNAAKAESLGLPLWVVVPTRLVRRAVAGRLAERSTAAGHNRIRILLPGEMAQELARCFPLDSPADTRQENGKTD